MRHTNNYKIVLRVERQEGVEAEWASHQLAALQPKAVSGMAACIAPTETKTKQKKKRYGGPVVGYEVAIAECRRRRSCFFYFSISEHADGERRGTCAGMKVPTGAARLGLFDAALHRSSSAFAVGMTNMYCNGSRWL